MQTIAFHLLDPHLALLVHLTKMPPSAKEWESYIGFLQAHPVTAILVHTLGRGVPTAAQRRALERLLRARAIRVAVLTDSAIARGIIVALGWVGIFAHRVFLASDVRGALAYLGASIDEEAVRVLIEGQAAKSSV